VTDRDILGSLARTAVRDLRLDEPEPDPIPEDVLAQREHESAAEQRHSAWVAANLGPGRSRRRRSEVEFELEKAERKREQKEEAVPLSTPEYRSRAEAALERAEENEWRLRTELGLTQAWSPQDQAEEDLIGDDVRCDRCGRIVFSDAHDKWARGGSCMGCSPPSWSGLHDPRGSR
jgi:hypothetical protein